MDIEKNYNNVYRTMNKNELNNFQFDCPVKIKEYLSWDISLAIPVFGLSLNEAVDLMRGKKGSPITITVSREGVDPFEIKIIRDIIKIQSVKSDVFNDVGYLRITSFTEQTESGLIKSIKKN